jgi:hypothetical protein
MSRVARKEGERCCWHGQLQATSLTDVFLVRKADEVQGAHREAMVKEENQRYSIQEKDCLINALKQPEPIRLAGCRVRGFLPVHLTGCEF